MESLLEGIAFALVIAAQILAVIAVHATRTKASSTKSASTDLWSSARPGESPAKDPAVRERGVPQSRLQPLF